MTKDDFAETVSKLFDVAKKNLQRDKTLQLTFYFDCPKEPIYFQPKFNAKLDLSVIRNQVAHLLKDNAARFYAFISEGHDPETKERMIIVQGFHKDGRFVNLSAPFIENGGKIQFKSSQKSTDIKTADGIFSDMFLQC